VGRRVGGAIDCQAYPGETRAAVEQAVTEALAYVADAERIPLDDQTCVRDYSAACPVGDVMS